MPSTSGPGSVPYDASAVAADARAADPSLLEEEAGRLASEAYEHLRRIGSSDVAALARALLDSVADVSHANVVARAAIDFCEQQDVDLSA